MLRYIVVFMAALFSLPSAEKWVVPEQQWKDVFQKAGVNSQYAQELLTKLQLASVSFGNPQSITPPTSFSPLPNSPAELLLEDRQVTVYYAQNARVRNHLWVVLNRPVTSLADVKPEEAVALAGAVNKILHLLETKFRIPHAVIAEWNETQPGNLDQRFTIEVIPSRPETARVHNLCDKIESNHHVLFRGLFPSSLPGPTEEERTQDIIEWKAALKDASPFVFSKKTEGDPIQDWVQVQTNLQKAARLILDLLHLNLSEKGVPIEREKGATFPIPDEIAIPKKGCAFCKQQVIESQKAFETPYLYLFYNFRPATPGAHFLLVPKRHTASYTGLTREEVADLHTLAQQLTQALREKFNRSDIKMYIQNGPSVGQTVPHCHMHLLLTPSPLRYLFFAINYEQETGLTADQMKPILEEIGGRLQALAKNKDLDKNRDL